MNTLFIVGAPRSGTNALRDSICSLAQYATWPCDEINYIWRYGNSTLNTDIITPSLITNDSSSYIHDQFLSQYLKCFGSTSLFQGANYLVEKTCANCLRLPFVSALFPNAKYIYIRRNRYDVIASSFKRWNSSFDLKYILAKSKYVPLSEIPLYASQFISRRIRQVSSSSKQLSSWGPRFEGIDSLRQSVSLIELIALQLLACTSAAELFFKTSSVPHISIDYEEFVQNPREILASSLSHLELPFEESSLSHSVSAIHSRSIGNYSKILSECDIKMIDEVVSSYSS